MRFPLLSTIVASLFLGTATIASAAPPPGYTLSWSDEFNQPVGSPPNPAVWNHETGNSGWGNNELEDYTNDPANAHIIYDPKATDHKALQILATSDSNGHYYSARLTTAGKVEPQYGYIEARIKSPVGKGFWPAFWMLGSNIKEVGWPRCGEVDIMETVGNRTTMNSGSLHGPGYSGGNPLTASYTLPGGQQLQNAYHIFAVLWKQDSITFYVDGHPYETRTPADVPSGSQWAYNHPFFFLLNLAVGGGWPGPPDATTIFPQNLRVDYIRVYKPGTAVTRHVPRLKKKPRAHAI